jgi:hypothetical protein
MPKTSVPLRGRLSRSFGKKVGAGTPTRIVPAQPEGSSAIPSKNVIQLSKIQLLNRAFTINYGERTSKSL